MDRSEENILNAISAIIILVALTLAIYFLSLPSGAEVQHNKDVIELAKKDSMIKMNTIEIAKRDSMINLIRKI